MHTIKSLFSVILGTFLLLVISAADGAADVKSYNIRCDDCSSVISGINQLGGTLTFQADNIGFITVELDDQLAGSFVGLSGIKSFAENKPVQQTMMAAEELGQDIAAATGAEVSGQSVVSELIAVNSLGILANGQTGDGSIVAVIDSGIANSPVFGGRLLGGENLVPDLSPTSATSRINRDHGTQVAVQIAANGQFTLPTNNSIIQSYLRYSPVDVVDLGNGFHRLSLLGAAPFAQLYAFKVWALGEGIPEQAIIAALDRTLTLRRNFDAGVATAPVSGDGSEENPFVYDSLGIDVVNMSIGGPNSDPGKDALAELVQLLLDEGVVVVVSAGNDGNGALTIGGPNDVPAGLTVGAVSLAPAQRVLTGIFQGFAVADRIRPTEYPQVSDFSSRGPTADGRYGVDVVAPGHDILTINTNSQLAVVNGTSFSAPLVSGVAALLANQFADRSAVAIRNAIVQAADADVIGGNPSQIDQGAGMLDGLAAFDLLAAQDAIDLELPSGEDNRYVEKNVEELDIDNFSFIEDQQLVGAGRSTRRSERNFSTEINGQLRATKSESYRSGRFNCRTQETSAGIATATRDCGGYTFTTTVAGIVAGKVQNIAIESKQVTDQIEVVIEDLQFTGTPNALTGDSLQVTLLNSLPTGDGPNDVNTEFSQLITGDTVITLNNPGTGLLRLALAGERNNGGAISATVSVTKVESTQPEPSATGVIGEDVLQTVGSLNVDASVTNQLIAELSWWYNHSTTPYDELTLVLISPSGDVLLPEALLASPSRVVVEDPEVGDYTVIVISDQIQTDLIDTDSTWFLTVIEN